MEYKPQEVEVKWQKVWNENNSFKFNPQSPNPKSYVLEMFPYPSGRIHMGHLRNYTIGDAIARYKRSQGFNVLHPMGWDAFGLPAENAAIENKVSPADWTYKNIDAMRAELARIGLSYDWSREVATCSPEYYRHEQKFFLEFLKNGLAYQKESTVNWDPVDNTVLANEQVIDGRGWRSGALVERRKLKQWFLKISDFSEDLLAGLRELSGWPDAVKTMQEKWIGKSEGAHIDFEIAPSPQSLVPSKLKVFTTRPDTIFGMSFCAVAPGHPIATELATKDQGLRTFIQECNQIANTEEALEKAEKKGFDTGLKIKHPFIAGKTVPLFIANFILMEYGTGAIFGCPAHDTRDEEFAKKYNLPIIPVVSEEGILENSEFLNGLDVAAAKKRAIAEFEKLGQGTGKTTYRLRDWGVSRQRYWGCPIPIIYCDSCGAVPVPEKDLPVELPKDVTFDKPGNPLAHHPTWKHVDCPSCGKPATRETDTFDTFFESSWYFARFCSNDNTQPLKDADKFLPVDNYIGGIEHAVLHLLYARFFTRALTKCGLLNVKEPFKNLLTQGMVCHPTFKNAKGEWIYPEEADANSVKGPSVKMSKSKKNVVDPTKIVASYGADTARLFMLSDSPPERDLEWSDEGIDGCYKFLGRVWRLALNNKPEAASEDLQRKINKAVFDVTGAFDNNQFNKVVAGIRTLFNELAANPAREGVEALLRLLNPLTPHVAQELWEVCKFEGNINVWPKANEALLATESVSVAVQVNGKKRAVVELPKDATEAAAKEAAFKEANVLEFAKPDTIKKFIYVPNKIINIVA
jgi:leucyl-tRNA synthetase